MNIDLAACLLAAATMLMVFAYMFQFGFVWSLVTVTGMAGGLYLFTQDNGRWRD